MDLNFDFIFIPTSKKVSGVRCQEGGSRELNPETIYPYIGIKLGQNLEDMLRVIFTIPVEG
jgi:hypothetical protein